jgi:excisionase family DNA binding protein
MVSSLISPAFSRGYDPLDQIEGQFVTTRQAADILNVPINTVTQWCRTGLIASRRLGGCYRIPKWVVRNLRKVRMPPGAEAKPFLKLSEAARILNVRADVLRRWCQKGKIPCRKVGNRYELSQRVVQQLLDE